MIFLIRFSYFQYAHPPSGRQVGKTYGLMGQKDQQELWYRKALDWYKDQAKKSSKPPSIPPAYYQYAGFPEKALTHFQDLQKKSSSKAYWTKLYYLEKIGILLAQLGKKEEAEKILQQLEEITSPYPAVLTRATYGRACIFGAARPENRQCTGIEKGLQAR